jgi:preprotein translocase subunit SecG
MFWINFAIYAFLVVLVVACPLMCLVILMQRSKQEGLGAAFGGGFTDSVWGAQTSNVLVKATVVFAATFFIVSIALARLYTVRTHLQKEAEPSSLQEQLLNPTVPMTATNASGTPVVPTATPMTSATPAVSTPASTNATPTMSAPMSASPATNAVPATKTPAAK